MVDDSKQKAVMFSSDESFQFAQAYDAVKKIKQADKLRYRAMNEKSGGLPCKTHLKAPSESERDAQSNLGQNQFQSSLEIYTNEDYEKFELGDFRTMRNQNRVTGEALMEGSDEEEPDFESFESDEKDLPQEDGNKRQKCKEGQPQSPVDPPRSYKPIQHNDYQSVNGLDDASQRGDPPKIKSGSDKAVSNGHSPSVKPHKKLVNQNDEFAAPICLKKDRENQCNPSSTIKKSFSMQNMTMMGSDQRKCLLKHENEKLNL